MLRIQVQYTSLIIHKVLLSFAIVLLLTGYSVAPVTGAQVADYTALPPFLSTEVTPNVMFMLDNSGSMKHSLYDGGSWTCSSYGNDYDPAKEYYGLFDGAKTYTYDMTIPIDYNGYNGSAASSYTIDTDSDLATDEVAALPGAFVEDAGCTPGAGVNCWNGSFLNWMVTRRIDAARNVMIGGKVESRAGFDYRGNDGDLEWKIVANNERSDSTICKTYTSPSAAPQTYTPFPDGTRFRISSPADSGNTETVYDPYAKLKAEGSLQVIINDENGSIIGESGIVEDFRKNTGQRDWETVDLVNTYNDPVVVATPLSYTGSDPSVFRVKDVTADSFKIRLEEWEYRDGYHTSEDISYLVIESGQYTLPGGEKIIAGTHTVNASGRASVDTSSAGFPVGSTPVILSSVTTDNNPDTVTTRLHDVEEDSFEIILQEEEDYLNQGDNALHPDETVAYIGLEQGSYFDGGSTFFQVGIQTVNSDWSTISFGEVSEPKFLANIQTSNDSDPAGLRYRNLTSTTVDIFVEEEKSDDDEMTHRDESVGYAIISQLDEFNLALVVDEEPTGLLHDVVENVRLGISFYKYNKDADIYNGERFHGGTLQLSIPHNPFIRNPDAATGSGYRDVSTPIKTDITHIVDAIEHYPLVWGTTPLAENYFEVIRYFQQVAPYYNSGVNSGDNQASYQVSGTWDPYYYEDPNGDGNTSDAGTISCAQSYILLFTDGEPFKDGYVPNNLPGYNFIDFDADNNGGDCFTTDPNSRACEDNLNDLSKWAHCADSDHNATCFGDNRDLRTDLPGEQNLTTYTVAFGQSTSPPILQTTAEYGGGIAYAAEDGRALKDQLTNAFTDIISRASGTAASVISNTRSGEGAIYQGVFFPEKEGANDTVVNWAGQIHALLVDAHGNMREDTNNNKRLDLEDDYFVVHNDDGTARRYEDGDGNQLLELDPATCPSEEEATPPDDVECYDSEVDSQDVDDLVYLWNSSNWLNAISDTDVESQRTSYLSTNAERYIFTWVDDNEDGVVDTTLSEVMDFTSSLTDLLSVTADYLTDSATIYPYLHLYPSFADIPTEISSLAPADFDEFLRKQTYRQINYIRGSDCADSTDSTLCNTDELEIAGNDITGSAMRSRQFDHPALSIPPETWRLGDIIYSTPTLVGRPAEAFHLLYRDTSYAPFAAKYNLRRNVIYSGANDGMVHAFNGGFFHSPTSAFCRELNPDYDPLDTTTDNQHACMENTSIGTTNPQLGAELWAYVPFNLLPHLYWLTQTTYNAEQHVYYVDQKPRIFDAKIFPEEGSCRSGADVDGVPGLDLDQLDNSGCIHPEGWGTVMVIGMRFGGGSIVADMDKKDGNSADPDDPTMKSAYMVFDISNPEEPPQLLAELTMPEMGFATNYPTVVVMKDGDHDKDFEDYDDLDSSDGNDEENRWFLAFGSGPADAAGDPGGFDAATGRYDRTVLENANSQQPAKFYMLDLVKLASDNELHSLDTSGDLTAGLQHYVILDNDSFVSDPITVDYDLDYNADVVYFGTISGENTATTDWGGKLRRIVVDDRHDGDDDKNPGNWVADSVLIDVGQPITAAPSAGLDDDGRHWVYFGTGRYFVDGDRSDTSLQSYYAIKEPLDDNGTSTDPLDDYKSWATVSQPTSASVPRSGGDLLNVTDYLVFTDESVVSGKIGGPTDWDELETEQLTSGGWYLDFLADDGSLEGERNLGQAALLGGLLSYTTFIPSGDICEASGTSDLWALYYKTGTAYFTDVLRESHGGASGAEPAKRSIGEGTDGHYITGLATSPSVHVGREEGSVVFVQSSTGEITRVEENNPLSTKSGMLSWRLR